MPEISKALNAERRGRMIDAGQTLFLREGFRGTTMEAIARDAGVAKATLYGYFPDKDAVFAAVVERLAAELGHRTEEALTKPGPAWRRVAAALAARHKAAFRMLEGAPRGDELRDSRSAARHLCALDDWLQREIVRALGAEGHPEPVRFAHLLIATAEGIARRARGAGEIGPAIRLVAERLLAS